MGEAHHRPLRRSEGARVKGRCILDLRGPSPRWTPAVSAHKQLGVLLLLGAEQQDSTVTLVIVCWCCCTECHQLGGLKQEIQSLKVLESRSPKSRRRVGLALSEGFSWFLVVADSRWCSLTYRYITVCLHHHMLFSLCVLSVSKCPSSSKDTSHWIKAHAYLE